MMKQILTTSGLLLLMATMNGAEPQVSASEKSEQPLSPETEMAIMRVMNLENRIQTLQTVPVKMTGNELANHFSGTWICFTTMRLNGQWFLSDDPSSMENRFRMINFRPSGRDKEGNIVKGAS